MLFEQFLLFVMMTSQIESSIEIGQFISWGENEDSMEGATGTLVDETSGSCDGDGGVPVPDLLLHLIKHGVKFKSISH